MFYVPIIDEVNKAFDTQFIDQILTNDEAISDVELEEKVFEYFDQVFMQYVPHLFNKRHDNNITRLIFNQFLLAQQNSSLFFYFFFTHGGSGLFH